MVPAIRKISESQLNLQMTEFLSYYIFPFCFAFIFFLLMPQK